MRTPLPSAHRGPRSRAAQRHASLALALLLPACAPKTDPAPAPSPREPSSTLTAEQPSTNLEAPQDDPVDWANAPHPSTDPGERPCRDDSECRTWRPSSWSPRVECCYEYGCDLDWHALHDDQWRDVRAWRQANPFDCEAELQRSGPCSTRPVSCALAWEARALCQGGVCALAAPPAGPELLPQASTCHVDSDCAVLSRSRLAEETRCCPDLCGPFVAVNQQALREIAAWVESANQDCGSDLCPAPPPCPQLQPATRCSAGQCQLAR